ncbi:hypothetical protein [Acidiferrimicrobium sp. IK]|uniref:hypothetical protein n=1 Tax=Acidiferrimicrobium sp. IK TaxID=2871700 RepID=UPI0021CB1A55|nr:hypothetical protein [Acidiferrimicrobium sp. IK]
MPKPRPRSVPGPPATATETGRSGGPCNCAAGSRLTTAMVDLDAVRQACEPIARWWQTTQTSGRADPDTLARAVRRARLLGPVPGPLGAALAYILAGCPDLDYPKVHAAFSRVASAAAATDRPTLRELAQPPADPVPVAVQLSLAGIPADTTHKRRASRR